MKLFNNHKAPVRAQNGMVATSQPLASAVGLDILKSGGNAFDAAIAIAAMVNVLEPMMTGVGGDVLALVYHNKSKQLEALNATGTQPKALDLAHYQKKGYKTIPEIGWESVNIPGAFDGWITLHEKYGSKPFAELLEPAIYYAKEGFPVGDKIAQFWDYGSSKLALFPDAAELFLIDGKAPKPGSIFKQKDLAKTLKLLGTGGREAFYEGPIAKKIVEFSQATKGFLTLEDFKNHRSFWTKPISMNYRGYDVYEVPPNSEGLVALEALKILNEFDLATIGSTDLALYYHLIIEALKLSFADGHKFISDPLFETVPVEALLSEEFISTRASLIRSNQSIPLTEPGKLSGDTTYFTVVDNERNAVSFIMSISNVFGSGIVPKGTGIVLNNRGCEFSLSPNHPNVVAAGKRPYHSIMPGMIFKDGHLFLSFGCMGGNTQPQGQVQIVTNLIDRHLNLQQALDVPRVRVIQGNEVAMEEALPDDIIRGLIAKGHARVMGSHPPLDWSVPSCFATNFKGGAQAIMVDPEHGSLIGASDPRLDGIATGY